MKLIGSTTSPFVRKVRLLMADTDYEFESIMALTPEGSKKLETYGPIKRVPILIVDDKSIFDSTIICEYLFKEQGIELSVDEKLVLRMIDELCDSCVILFQQKVWGIDKDWQNELSTRMFTRAIGILDSLEALIQKNELTAFQQDWLFCVLDWFNFREVIDWHTNHPEMNIWYEEASKNPKYESTKPTL